MDPVKRICRWWIEGWCVLVYYTAFYIVLAVLLAGPVYLWHKGEYSLGDFDILLLMVFGAVYTPFVFRFTAFVLGRFPLEDKSEIGR